MGWGGGEGRRVCGQNAAEIMIWVMKGFNFVTVVSGRTIRGDLGVQNTSR